MLLHMQITYSLQRGQRTTMIEQYSYVTEFVKRIIIIINVHKMKTGH